MRIESVAWSGESHGWENTCSGSQVSRCCTDWHETCHGWGVETRGLMTSWWPWHGCHAVTGTSTLQQSWVAPASSWTWHCLYLHLSSPVSWSVWLFVFSWFYFDNQTIIMLTLHSQETPQLTKLEPLLSRDCHESVTHDTSVTRAWLLLSPPVCCLCSTEIINLPSQGPESTAVIQLSYDQIRVTWTSRQMMSV